MKILRTPRLTTMYQQEMLKLSKVPAKVPTEVENN